MKGNKLIKKIDESSLKAVEYFQSKINTDGSLNCNMVDLSCYYKVPEMFFNANKKNLSIKILEFVKNNFMTQNGDFMTSDILKSVKPEYLEFWSYINGWIFRTANKLSYSDLSDHAYQYLSLYGDQPTGGFLTNNVVHNNGITDVLTTAHHGLLNMESGRFDVALKAAEYLCSMMDVQKDKDFFFLRSDSFGNLIIEYSENENLIYSINKNEKNQLYFMIGYPAAFLAILYKSTKIEKFLTYSEMYLSFALECRSVLACDTSHKIAWAASILYEITANKFYLDAVEKITEYFIDKQGVCGLWYLGEGDEISYDQSAEIACWFMEIKRNIIKAERANSR